MAKTELLNEYQRLCNILKTQRSALDGKEKTLLEMESKVRQGLLPNDNVSNLKQNLEQLPYFLRPSNVGNINEVIWPFYFATPVEQVNPSTNKRSQFSVTQEAAFVLMNYTKTVYILDTNTNDISYIDPDDVSTGQAPDLKFFFRDAVSSREFFNHPIDMNLIGTPRWPSVLPSPQMFLPNSTVEIGYINDHATNVYLVQTQFFGYRIRIEKAKDILSLVGG